MMQENVSYSVLMSVYEKEKTEYLRQSVESAFKQTVLPSQFVLVIDGAVGNELSDEIKKLETEFGLSVFPLKENVGLGKALNFGLAECQNEIVVRMDSDDISKPDRVEKQLELMKKTNADIVSSAVAEFEFDAEKTTAVKYVPETNEEILSYIKKRNPFNHPAVMYKKSSVESAGGYMDYPFFEDYELFARMIMNGCTGANVREPLVCMRVGNGMYLRRGGIAYVKKMLVFYRRLHRLKITGIKECFTVVLPRIIIALLPSGLRKKIYQIFLRG